jgi:hypothetical protein
MVALMKWLMATGMALLVLYGPMVPGSFAESKRQNVTPYGDFCPRFTKYGRHRGMLSRENSRTALRDYYGKKGYGVFIQAFKGRFIKAVVVDEDTVVDTILFDRMTGRVRSIH